MSYAALGGLSGGKVYKFGSVARHDHVVRTTTASAVATFRQALEHMCRGECDDLKFSGGRALMAAGLRDQGAYIGPLPDAHELAKELGDTSAGLRAEWALDIDRHARGAGKMLNCDRISLPSRGCYIDACSLLRQRRPDLVSTMTHPSQNVRHDLDSRPFPSRCISTSRKELMRYLVKLEQSNILGYVLLSDTPCSSSGESLSSGIMAVGKDDERDRCITDRRRLNWYEKDVLTPGLAHATQLTRISLGSHERLQFSLSDLPDYFHAIYGGEEHLKRNGLGPSWPAAELRAQGLQVPSRFRDQDVVQPALRAIGMGDKKSVAVAQEFHYELLERGKFGVECMEYGIPIPSGDLLAGVVVDDLGVFAKVK